LNLKGGRQIYYRANKKTSPVLNLSQCKQGNGLDQVIDSIVTSWATLSLPFRWTIMLKERYRHNDLLLVGNIDEYHLNDLREKRKIY
jgi:hypothetical protein